MAFKKSEKFWAAEPVVVHEWEKGSKLAKSLLGITEDGDFCAAIQTFYMKDGVEIPSKGWFMKSDDGQEVLLQIKDTICALQALEDGVSEFLKDKKKGGKNVKR